MREFLIAIEFLSEWKISDNSGVLLKCDNNGLPYIPAKTLTASLRKACERVAMAIDQEIEPVSEMQSINRHLSWHILTAHMFGQRLIATTDDKRYFGLQAQPAQLIIEPAYLPKPLVQLLIKANNMPFKQSLFLLKSGLSFASRATNSSTHLYVDQVVRGGCVLYAKAKLNFSEQYQQNALAMLWAAVKTIEQIGGRNKRGFGRCRISLQGLKLQEETEYLAQLAKVAKLPARKSSYGRTSTINYCNHSQQAQWCIVQLRLITLQPLLLNFQQASARFEIPGYFLLRPLLAQLIALAGKQLYSHLSVGDIQVLNATPEIKNERGISAPLLYSDFQSICLAPENANTDGSDISNHGASVSSYINASALNNLDSLVLHKFCLANHFLSNEIARENNDSVHYRAIPVGSILRSELRIKQSIVDEFANRNQHWWLQLFKHQSTIQLGVAKKGDYGKAKIQVLNNLAVSTISDKKPIVSSQYLKVLLLSDLLIRDQRLALSADATTLMKTLEIKLSTKDMPLKLSLEQQHNAAPSCIRQIRLDSWQVQWSRPRPSLIALAAGSSFVFKVISGQINAATLLQLERSGLGDRRAEGFGQLCFNPAVLTKPEARKLDKLLCQQSDNYFNPSCVTELELNARSYLDSRNLRFAQLLEYEVCYNQMLENAKLLAQQANKRQQVLAISEKFPSNSLLVSLRYQALMIQDHTSLLKFRQWLVHLSEDKWPHKVLLKLFKLVESMDYIARLLNLDALPVLVSKNPNKYLHAIWPVGVKYLLDTMVQAELDDREIKFLAKQKMTLNKQKR